MSDHESSIYESRSLLTVKSFSDLVGQHPMSVYRRIRENRQPGVIRVGRDIRIDIRRAIRPASNNA